MGPGSRTPARRQGPPWRPAGTRCSSRYDAGGCGWNEPARADGCGASRHLIHLLLDPDRIEREGLGDDVTEQADVALQPLGTQRVAVRIEQRHPGGIVVLNV